MKKITLFFILFSIFCHAQIQQKKDVFDIARSGTIEELKLLETKNPDTINVVNQHGFTPLILACYRGNTAIAEYLIPKVKDINHNSSSGTALAATAVKGDLTLTKKLLDNRANPNIQDATGMTPLLYAIQFKNKALIELLIQYKANTSLADSTGKSPFEYALFTKNQEIINLFKH